MQTFHFQIIKLPSHQIEAINFQIIKLPNHQIE